MEREDPIRRIERREAQRKAGGNLKGVVIVMAIVAACLAIALVYVFSSKNKLVGELNDEKAYLTEQLVALQNDYADLTSEYDNINFQLDSSREEIAQLIEKVRTTEATNRNKIRQYERELGTLRSIMRGYIQQIDSLNTLNRQLTADAASARQEAAASRRLNEELTQQVESLTDKVSVGSIIKARELRVDAYNSGDKPTDRSARVARLLVSMTLVENDLAQRGPMRVYVRIFDPAGDLLLDGSGVSFVYGGELFEATASREVDYQGVDLDLGIYVNNIPYYAKGIYYVEAFTDQSLLGTAELLLR